jgi:AcrR family transcriptional regulator
VPSRFFHCPKASRAERGAGCEGLDLRRLDLFPNGGRPDKSSSPSRNPHPTVKPLTPIRWLMLGQHGHVGDVEIPAAVSKQASHPHGPARDLADVDDVPTAGQSALCLVASPWRQPGRGPERQIRGHRGRTLDQLVGLWEVWSVAHPTELAYGRQGGAADISGRVGIGYGAAAPTDRRTAILEAAARMISVRGRGLRVEEIAAEADVSTGLIYYHFDDRSGLLRETLDYVNERASSYTRGKVSGDEPAVKELGTRLLSELNDADEVVENSLVWGELRASATFEPDLQDALRATTKSWSKEIAAVIERAREEGDARVGASLAAAERLTALLEGLSERCHSGSLSRRRARSLLREAIDNELDQGRQPRLAGEPRGARLLRRARRSPRCVTRSQCPADRAGERERIGLPGGSAG